VLKRWLKFNSVGILGAVLQLLALKLLVHNVQLNYQVATAIAVELAIVHNFIWHEAFTWRHAGLPNTWQIRARRLLRFNFSNGAVSLIGNLVLMRIFAGTFGWPLLLSNLIAICACALLNFYLSERHVFVSEP
jgi:putative flippase GtrA